MSIPCRMRSPACRGGHEAAGLCHYHYGKLLRAGRISGLADPEQLRQRIAAHVSRGRTVHALAGLADLCPKALAKIADGRTARVRATTIRRIMGVPLPPTTVGTMRRLQALMRLGWTLADIAADAGVSEAGARSVLRRHRTSDRVALAVAAAYERLSGTAGPSTITRSFAARHGWASPHAWDSIDLDDPAARPVMRPSRRDLAAAGQRNTAELEAMRGAAA